jgi:type 1 glutamine amidotransferase
VQPGRIFGADPRFPGVAPFAQGLELVDEWYSYKNFAADLHVLLWLGTWSLQNTGPGSCYRRAPYPIAWTRRHGKGRVFYLGLGHTPEVWRNPVFLDLVAGGIRWAGGQGPAPRPDVARVTPGYRETPPRDRAP